MKSTKKLILAAVLLGALVVVGTLGYQRYARGPMPAGPMIQMLQTDGFTIVWEISGGRPAVARIKGPDGAWFEPASLTRKGDRHVAVVEGLQPATFYDYEIRYAEGDEPPLATARTRTAPKRGGAFRFLAFGDSGSGYPQQYELADRMVTYDPDLCVHVGDIVYPDGRASHYYRKFYQPYRELLMRAAMYPVLGNHDWDEYQGKPAFDVFILPENGPKGAIPERHFWFDVGDVRFIGIDTDARFDEYRQQIGPWLDEVLSSSGDRWKIAYFHHCVYTHGNHTPLGKVLQVIMPRLEAHGTHVVLVGHNHKYERSHPIRDGQIVPPQEGIVHVTTGAGGAKLRTSLKPKPDYLCVQNHEQCSFTVVDVTPERLSFQQIGLDGEVIDRFAVHHRVRPLPTSKPVALSLGAR